MSQAVYHTMQVGRQTGTMSAPGIAVAAGVLVPVSEPVVIGLDRATTYPAQDWGRNAAARAGTGFHGVRGVTFPASAHARFEDLMWFLEPHYAGDISPQSLGGGMYSWVYPLEVGLPTITPLTVESGTESAQDQWAAVGAFVDELTLSFDDLEAPGAHPWSLEANFMALNRVQRALTSLVALPSGLETMQGQNSLIYMGTTATAFASLGELQASLIGFSITTRRHLEPLPYGGDTLGASAFGFSEKTDGEVTFKIRISSGNETAVYDKWDNGSPFADDVHVRISVPGSGTKAAYLDFALGMTAVPVGSRGGERVYEVTGSLLDDTTLDALAQLTVVNGVSTLTENAS